ncbi:BBE domain-containing protein [Carnobacterium mobile]|uniref:BBE domain-containing protein n=1 Tax=Carnobacterium mobile TaxID=2750 RepID=UPI001865DEC8|nr:BBE domain-containing protein [Carnobacterium mobile]
MGLLKGFSEGIDINFLGITQVDELNQMYKPANLKKLKQLKQKYDPTTCFSGTLNIQ